jgi:nitroimidazol reductase NimA-like FMN-containing flavoprotein (pyridoxamine 5'-phosphate oxidase superfamily)
MTHMTADEKQTFLAGLHVGVLGINDPGKGPLTIPVWYDYAPDGQLWFLTGPESRKGKLLTVGDRISLCAQTETPPYVYVSVEGTVASIDEPGGEGLPMAVRYLGEKQGRAYSEGSNLASVVVRLNCENWLGVDYSKT